jgi:hypothetical protein
MLVAIQEAIASLLVSKPHMVDVKPYLTSSLSNYCYANLHELLIKSILEHVWITFSPMTKISQAKKL